MQAIANVAAVLKPGSGQVLVRDYAEGDLAQLRLAGPSRSQRLSENFYVRSDGTRAYYFTKVRALTSPSLLNPAGISCPNSLLAQGSGLSYSACLPLTIFASFCGIVCLIQPACVAELVVLYAQMQFYLMAIGSSPAIPDNCCCRQAW